MSRSSVFGLPYVHAALATTLLLPISTAAQAPSAGSKSATSSFSITLVVRPAFRILETRPIAGGHEYRVWTNMKSVQLNGQEYRFGRVGEATIVVPGQLIELQSPDSTPPSVPQQQGG